MSEISGGGGGRWRRRAVDRWQQYVGSSLGGRWQVVREREREEKVMEISFNERFSMSGKLT